MDEIALDLGCSYADIFVIGFFFGSIFTVLDYFIFKLGRYIQLRLLRGLENENS